MPQVTLYPAADARVTNAGSYDNTNYGSSPELAVGCYSDGTESWSYLKFDALASIPRFAKINSAILKLFQYNDDNDWLTPTIQVAAIVLGVLDDFNPVAAWTSAGITWNNKPEDLEMTVSLDDDSEYLPTVLINSNLVSPWQLDIWYYVQEWVNYAMDALLQSWLGFYNNGFVLKSLTGGDSNAKYFRSHNYGTVSQRPQLLVDYTAPVACTAPSHFYIGENVDSGLEVVTDDFSRLHLSGALNGIAGGDYADISYIRIERREYNAATGVWGNWSAWYDKSYLQGDNAILTVLPPATRGNSYQYRCSSRTAITGLYTGLDSGFVVSTNILTRQPVSACRAPSSLSIGASVSDVDVAFNFSGASAGYGNDIVGYDIDYAESVDGASWGAWQDLKIVDAVDGACSTTVSPSATRGTYRKFRIRTMGSAGAYYYSSFYYPAQFLQRTPYNNCIAPTVCALNKTAAETEAILTWNSGGDGFDNPVVGYNILQSDDNGLTWTLHKYIDGKNTLTTTVTPNPVRGNVRKFSIVSKGTIVGYDSPRCGVPLTLTTNRIPKKIVSPIVANKNVIVAGNVVRISFLVVGDEDGNLARHEIALKDTSGNWNGAPTIVATNSNITQQYVDVNTAGWSNGKTWRFYVRGVDSEEVAGEWSTNYAEVIVGAIMSIKYNGQLRQVLPKTKHDGSVAFLIPYTRKNGVLYKTK